MANKCNNNITVESLPIKQSALGEDYLLLYNSNVTSRIKVSDLVLGAENFDFYPEIISIINRLDELSLVTNSGSANWTETYNTVQTNSATWASLNSGIATQLLDEVAINHDDWTQVATTFKLNSGTWEQTTADLNSKSDRWDNIASIVEASQVNWDSAYTATRDGIAAIHEALEQIEQQPWYTYMYGGSGTSGGGGDTGGGFLNSELLNSIYTTTYANSSRWSEVDIPELYEQRLAAVYSNVTTYSAQWNTPDIPQEYIDKITTLEDQIDVVNQRNDQWTWSYETVRDNHEDWTSTYTTVHNLSTEWKWARSKVVSTSATWDNVSNIVLNKHEDWTDAYERVTADATKWDSAYTRIQTSANFWDTAYSIVNTKSDNWDTAYDRIVADADDWSTTHATVITRSPKWEETYLKVFDDGPDWDDTFERVRDYHQNWDDTYDRVLATGDEWDGVYLTVQTNSADWFSPPEIINLVTSNSGMWNGAWSFVNSDSATNNTNYNRTTFVNTSGDTITGDLDIDGELTVFGDIVLGDPTHGHGVDHTPENTEHLTLQNVRDFKTIQLTVETNSAVWLTPPELTALVNANSGLWDGAYSFVNSDSATNNTDYNRNTFVNVSGDTITGALSVQDDVVVDHKLYVLSGEIVLGDGVHSHEHIHEPQNSEAFTLHDIRHFKSTHTSVFDTSANWDSVYTSVLDNSAVWFSPPELTALVNANSGLWNGAYNFVHSDSATNNTDYNRTTFINASGDTMFGELSAKEDVFLDKGLYVLSGTIIFGDGVVEHDWSHDPDAIEPLTIKDVRDFKSVEASVHAASSSWDDVYNTVNVNSGVWFTPPDLTALVNSNSANWISTHLSVHETSGEWDSVYDSVLATSAEWDAVYNFVNADSATNNTTYNRDTFVDVTGDMMTGDLTVAGMISATEGVFTSLTALSSVINVIDIRARELSGYEIIDGDLKIEEELHVKGRVGIESELNLLTGEIYFGDGTYDHVEYHNEHLLEKLSKQNVKDFKSTHISVFNTSADWDAVYAFVNADSATNNTDYNRTTFINVSGDVMTGSLDIEKYLTVHHDFNIEHGSIWFGHQHFEGDHLHHADDSNAEELNRENVVQFKSTYGSVLTTSATWDSVYASVLATSANWDSTHASVLATSANWDSTHASVLATSSNWDSTHASVLATSSNWDSTHTSVNETSGEWDAVYAFVNADSATNNTDYNRNTFVNVSGDTITGDLTVEGKTELLGGLNVQGLLSGGEAFFTSLTALSSYVNVIDIKVRELSGYEIIDGELVVHDDITAAHNLFVTEGAVIFGDSGVNHGIPHNPLETEALTKQDVRNFKSTQLSVFSTSGNWNSVYNSVLDTSADWDSVYSFVNSDSATNNTDYNRTTFVNTSGDVMTGSLDIEAHLHVHDDINIEHGSLWFGHQHFHHGDPHHVIDVEELSRENVIQFKSTYNSVLATSANWDSTHASVFANSSDWDSVYASVLATSANWDSTHASVLANSSDWDSVYDSVLSTSANWDSTHASVFANSSDWDSVYNSVLSTSANWDSTHASVLATSSEWDAVYTFVNADSATNNTNYNRTTFVNTSGDTMTGDLIVQTNVITENIKTDSPTKTLSLYGGTDVSDGAHIKIFGGNQGDSTKDNRILLNTDDLYIGDVHDVVDGPEPWMFRISTDDKKVVIGGIEPNSNNMLTVSGSSYFRDNVTVSADISAKGDIYLSKSSLIFSDGDNRNDEIWTAVDSINSKSTHSSVQATSGEWDAVYTFVNSDSATNNTTFNRDSYVNVTGDKMTGDLEIVGTLSASNGIFTSLTALSTVINVIDIKARELSGYDIIDGDLKIEEELHVGKRIESTNDINLINGQILFGDGTWDHDQYHNPQLLEELNRQDVVQFKSTYTSVKPNSANWVSTHLSVLANSSNWMSTHQSVLTTSATWDSVYDSVLATSGEWDAVYSFVNADSATNNTNYNRNTFVNVSGDTVTGELSVVQDLTVYSDLNVRRGEIVFGDPFFHDTFHEDELESLTRENVREFKSTHASVFNTSALWDSVYDSVLTTSANWDSTHASVLATSSDWDSVYDSVLTTSGEWDAVYAFVNADSATNNTNYNRNTFVNVSGDTITGTLSVKDEVSFDANLNMYNGEIVFGNPYFHDTFHAEELEPLTRENVREFKSTHASVFNTSGEWDSVYDSVCATSGLWDSVYDSVLATSGNWDSVYDSVLTTSGEWDAVYAFVNADSATNNTNYNRTTFVNASGDTMTGDLTVDANIINTGYVQTDTIAGNDPTSHVNIYAGTGENDGAYIELYGSNNADSTNDGRIRIHGEEILIGDIYDVADGYTPWTLRIDTDNNNIVIGGQSVIDDSVLTVLGKTTIDGVLNVTDNVTLQSKLDVASDITTDANINLTNGYIVFDTETLTKKNVQDFKSTHTSVLETSAEWDAVYAFVNADSATNNTNYNRNTFVNVSGDTMTGDLTVDGTVSATNAIFTYLTALSTVINVVDIKARELSGYDIIDGDLKIEEELYVGERIESTGDINLINGQILFGDGTWDHDDYHNYHLLEELNRQDVIEFKSTYTSVCATSALWDSVYDSVLTTSGLWDSVYDSVLTTSGEWDAVYAFVNADSATNNTNYNRNTFVNVSGDSITGALSVAEDLSIYSDFKVYNGEIIFGNPYYHDAYHAEELEPLTRENVREFKSTHASVFNTSAEWDSVYDSVCATSALWDSVYDSVLTTSAEWDSVYDSVCATSALWDSVYDSVLTTSGLWDSVYDSVLTTSGLWDSVYDSVLTTSGEWDAVYAFVNADSATNNTNYNRNTFVNVSGDTMTGDLTVEGIITGHTIKTADPTTQLKLNGGNNRLDGSAIELYGTNNTNSSYDGRMMLFSNDIYIGEIYDDLTGYGPWLVRYDVDDQQIIFGGTVAQPDSLLTVKGTTFLEDDLTVSADISAKGDIYLSKTSLIFSDGDNRDDEVWTATDSINSKSTHTSVTNTSGNWDSVYSYTQSDSATNNTNYNRNVFVNVSGDTMTGDLTVDGTVSATNAIFTYLTALSTVINVVDIKARELSGYDIIDGDLKIEEELYVGERIETTGDINLISGQILFGDGTWDHDNYHNYHLLEELNRQDVVQFKSTHNSVFITSSYWNSVYNSVYATSTLWDSVYDSVLTTSGEWDAVYTFVNADSATNNTNYNRNTFVNVSGDTITGTLSVQGHVGFDDDLNIYNGEIIFGNPYYHDAYHAEELEPLTRENVREFKSTHASVFNTSGLWDSVYDSVCATSALWDSVYDSVLTTSGNWDSVYDSVLTTSAEWDAVYAFVNADSATNNTDYNRNTFVNVSGDTITGKLSVTEKITTNSDLNLTDGKIIFGDLICPDECEDLTKKNVQDFKSTHTSVLETSGLWDSVYHSVCTTSGNWDSTHTTVFYNSGNWESVYNSVLETSAEWDAVYSFVNADSATNNTNYNRTTFVNTSGDTMTGDLIVQTNVITENIKTDDATKALRLYGGTDSSDGARIELYGGNQNNSTVDNRLMFHADDIFIGDVFDVVDNNNPWVLHINVDSNQTAIGGLDSIDNSTLTVHGKTTISGELRSIQDIIAESNITLTNGYIEFDTETLTKKNVQDFKSTHTSVLETSGEWDAVYAFVNADSATNNTNYNRNTFVNVSGDTMTGDFGITGDVTVNGMVSATDGFFTNLTALSTVINVIDIRARELSGYEIIDGTLDIEEELHVGQRIEAKDDINLISGSIIFGQGHWGTDCYHDPLNLEYLTKQNVKDFKSTQISVCATSALWDSVYESVCATSALWDSVYDSVLTTSALWDSVYDSVLTTSAEWDSVYDSVCATSAQWDAVYAWVNSDSATNNTTYNRNTFVNVSGDHMTGSLEIDGSATIHGDLTVDGNVWFNATNDDTGITTLNLGDDNTDIIVFNADVKSDIIPNQSMTYNLGTFDHHWGETYTHNICAFGNGAVKNNFLITDGMLIFGDEVFEHGHVHVPGDRETMTKFDVRNFKSTHISVCATSALWDSVYDSVCATSALWDSVYESVCATSAEWDSVYDSVCATSALWDSVYDSVCATSALWDSVYDSVCATSGLWDSVYESVCATSAEWDAVYAFVNADSATNNTDYNRNTFVNVSGDHMTGSLEIDGDTTIHGDLTVDGNVWFNANNTGGNNTIYLGDENTDNVVFKADVDSNIIPDKNMTYDLGSVDQHWNNIYTHNVSAHGDLNVNGTTDLSATNIHDLLSAGDVVITDLTAHGDVQVTGTTDLNHLNITGLLSGVDAVFTSMTALSTVVDVIDIKVRELSGYDIIDGDLRVDGRTTTDMLLLTQSDDPYSLANNGWQTSNFTGDSDSGVGDQYVYTHAVNVYGTTEYIINGVQFESETTGSGENWSISTGVGDALNHEQSTVTGSVGNMISDRFRYIVDAQKIILDDLTINKKYLFTLYVQAWSTDSVAKTAELSSTANSETITVSQNAYANEASDGLLINYVFVANEKTVEFTFKPTDDSSWNFYAFSNREVWGYESETLVANDVTNFKSTYGTVLNTSGRWESVYNFVNADSATNNTDYNRNTFVNVSGDTITGSLSVKENLDIDGETTLMGNITAGSNLHVQGDLRVDGNVWLLSDIDSQLYLGESVDDVVLFQAPVDSNISPLKPSERDLGDSEHSWRRIYVDEIVLNTSETLEEISFNMDDMAAAIQVNDVVQSTSGNWNESYTQAQYLTAATNDLSDRVESLYHYTVSNFDKSVVTYSPTLQEYINDEWATATISVGDTIIVAATNKVYVLVERDGSLIENWVEVNAKPNNLFYRANANHTDIIDTFNIEQFRSAKYIVEVEGDGELLFTELTMVTNGRRVFLTEYGMNYTTDNPFVQFDATLNNETSAAELRIYQVPDSDERAWTPNDLQLKPLTWLDASDETKVVVDDSNRFNRWENSGTTDLRMVSYPGAEPEYVTSGDDQLNGLNVLKFTSGSDFLESDYEDGTSKGKWDGDPVIWFSVFKPTDINNFHDYMLWFRQFTDEDDKVEPIAIVPGDNDEFFGQVWMGDNTKGKGSYPLDQPFSYTDLSNQWNIFELELDPINETVSMYLNGRTIQQGAPMSYKFPKDAEHQLRLHANWIGSEFTDGYFAEFLVIPNYQRQKVEGYLAHKWGIQDNLPVDHVYKEMAPYMKYTVKGNRTNLF